MSGIGLLSQIWDGFVTYLGSTWLAFGLIFIAIVALISVTVKVNALVSLYLATIPFVIILLYNASLGNSYAIAGAVILIGSLFGLAIYTWQNR